MLFRLCDLVVDGDTAGALVLLEQLSEQGQDIGRLVVDLLEHLRHLMLVQHMGEVPDTLPVTDETRERLREQANQLGAATVVRLIDLLHVAVDDMRQGGDPRLPLELALVKVTRTSAPTCRASRSPTAWSSSSRRRPNRRRPAGRSQPTEAIERNRAGPPHRPSQEPTTGPPTARRETLRLPPDLELEAASGGLAPLGAAGGRAARSHPAQRRCSPRRSRRALEGDIADARVPAAAAPSTARRPRSRRAPRSSRTRSTR